MGIGEFMTRLGAPLANVRTSWGSVRKDGTVVLITWSGETKRKGFPAMAQLIGKSTSMTRERAEHIEMMRSGRRCLMVMRHGTNGNNNGKFNEKMLWEAGDLFERDGDVYCYLARPVNVEDVK